MNAFSYAPLTLLHSKMDPVTPGASRNVGPPLAKRKSTKTNKTTKSEGKKYAPAQPLVVAELLNVVTLQTVAPAEPVEEVVAEEDSKVENAESALLVKTTHCFHQGTGQPTSRERAQWLVVVRLILSSLTSIRKKSAVSRKEIARSGIEEATHAISELWTAD